MVASTPSSPRAEAGPSKAVPAPGNTGSTSRPGPTQRTAGTLSESGSAPGSAPAREQPAPQAGPAGSAGAEASELSSDPDKQSGPPTDPSGITGGSSPPETAPARDNNIAHVPLTEPAEIAGEPDDSDPDENDSAYGGGWDQESTTTVAESIFSYRKLHGRTYHRFGDTEYWAPNDERQNEGLDIAHHMLLLAHNHRLFLAPVENPHRVLDVGTGTGIWAIDFADEFPAAEVIGTDLSPIQPTWVPPNCRFEIDDASKEWTYADASFDYIHLRCMMGCFKDWLHVYRECFRCLKPGGWIEHMDFSVHIRSDDGSIPADAVWGEWTRLLVEAGEKTGQTFEVVDRDNFVGWIKDVGFPAVTTFRTKIPIGTWPADAKWKELGLFQRASFEEGLEGYMLYVLAHVHGWEIERVQVWLASVRKAATRKDWHAYFPCITAYAQKPH